MHDEPCDVQKMHLMYVEKGPNEAGSTHHIQTQTELFLSIEMVQEGKGSNKRQDISGDSGNM